MITKKARGMHPNSSLDTHNYSPPLYDIFLGGSCGETVWRRELVIPYLKKRNISYYDPQRAVWSKEMIYEEAIAKENSSLFLFVLDPTTVNATSFLEIAYFATRQSPKLVVVFLDRKEWSHKAHPLDLPDRERTCDLIETILTRHSVPLLSSINEALDYIDEMIIGDKPWKAALADKLQRIPYLKIQGNRTLRKVSHTMTSLRSSKSTFAKYCTNVVCLLAVQVLFIGLLVYLCPLGNDAWLAAFVLVFLLINVAAIASIPLIKRWKGAKAVPTATLILPPPPLPRISTYTLNEKGEQRIGATTIPSNTLRQQPHRLTRQSASGSFLKPTPVGYDVFLSCSSSNELDWMTQRAIPQLEKNSLTFTSSVNCVKEMKMPLLHASSHILYYIPSYKTFLSGMIEIAYYIGHSDWQVTVCVPREAECLVLLQDSNHDPKTVQTVARRNECYQMAFCYLKDMANRRQCRVFTHCEEAIKHIATKHKLAREQSVEPHEPTVMATSKSEDRISVSSNLLISK
uniref:TIR domain-containing protein n=1 Tax=Rhabditophanes sp. KR3021 TaxID=114890 RepID=A0AC35UFG2_9BILA